MPTVTGAAIRRCFRLADRVSGRIICGKESGTTGRLVINVTGSRLSGLSPLRDEGLFVCAGSPGTGRGCKFM